MRKHRRVALVFFVLSFACSHLATGQTAETSLPPGVPRLMKFSGVVKDASGYLLNGTVSIGFAVYANSTGGAPLWRENQTLQFSQGEYTAFLGQSSANGIPAELFSSGQSRWLGLRILAPGEEEQPRTFLTSVPYALKAVDADTLGGLPASAFLRVNPESSGAIANPVPIDPLPPVIPVPMPTSALNVTTPGGTKGTVPVFSSSGVIANSPLKITNDAVVMRNLENVRYADQFHCPSSTGCGGASDFGAQVNAAYASCPATGCRIRIPAGKYTVSTPINFGVPQKTVKLECDAGSSNNITYPDQGATELDYTGTSGAAITMATGGGTGSGIEGCTLIGVGGSNNTAIGLLLSTASKQTYRDLFIAGFGVGVEFGNWVFLDNFYNLQLENNTTNLYAPSSITVGTGESVGFFGGVFTNKSLTSFSPTCVDIEGGQAIVMSFYNVSFDQCGVTVNIPGGQQFLFSGSHFEDPSAGTNSDFLTVGPNCISCQIILSGSDVFETHASSRNEFFSLAGGSRITIIGGIYLAAEPMPQVITSTNPANAVTVLGAEKLNQIGAWVSGTYAAFTIIDPRQYQPLTVAGGPIILGGNPTVNGSLVSAGLSQSRTWTFPDASGTVMLSGGSGANTQSKHGSGCRTAPRSGATCTTTITWNHPFADTDYSVSCTGEGIASGIPLGGGLVEKNRDSVSFRTVTASTEAAKYDNISCVALHE